MIDINLLPQRNVLDLKERKLRGRLVIIMVASTVLTAGLLGSALLGQAYFARQESELRLRKTEALGELGKYSQLATDLRTLEAKVAGISEVRTSGLDYATVIRKVTDFFPSTVAIGTLSVNQNAGVGLTLTANDKDAAGSTFDLLEDESQSPLLGVKVSGLRLDSSGHFLFAVGGNFNSHLQ